MNTHLNKVKLVALATSLFTQDKLIGHCCTKHLVAAALHIWLLHGLWLLKTYIFCKWIPQILIHFSFRNKASWYSSSNILMCG